MRRSFKRRAFTLVEVMVSIFLVGAAASIFYAIVPMAAKTGRMVSTYQQASSVVQHKVDQVRGVGYGRLTYTELRAAGVIDATPDQPPYRFTAVDSLATMYPNPVGTMNVTDYNDRVRQVTVNLTWTGGPNRPSNGSLSVSVLVPKG